MTSSSRRSGRCSASSRRWSSKPGSRRDRLDRAGGAVASDWKAWITQEVFPRRYVRASIAAECERRKGRYGRHDATAADNPAGRRHSLRHKPPAHRALHRHTRAAWDQGRRPGGGPQGGDDRHLNHPGLDPRAAAVQELGGAWEQLRVALSEPASTISCCDSAACSSSPNGGEAGKGPHSSSRRVAQMAGSLQGRVAIVTGGGGG